MRRLPPLNALKAFEAAGRHLSFTRAVDELFVTQAAVDGLGVTLGRSILVADDIAAGRLIKPFDLSLRAEFAYFLVCPESHIQRRKLQVFRDWIFKRVSQDNHRRRKNQNPPCVT